MYLSYNSQNLSCHFPLYINVSNVSMSTKYYFHFSISITVTFIFWNSCLLNRFEYYQGSKCPHMWAYLQTCHRVIAALCVWAVDMSVSTVSTQPSIYSIYTWGCTVHTLGGLTAAVDTPQSRLRCRYTKVFSLYEGRRFGRLCVLYCIWNIRIDIYNKENQKLKERIQ